MRHYKRNFFLNGGEFISQLPSDIWWKSRLEFICKAFSIKRSSKLEKTEWVDESNKKCVWQSNLMFERKRFHHFWCHDGPHCLRPLSWTKSFCEWLRGQDFREIALIFLEKKGSHKSACNKCIFIAFFATLFSHQKVVRIFWYILWESRTSNTLEFEILPCYSSAVTAAAAKRVCVSPPCLFGNLF